MSSDLQLKIQLPDEHRRKLETMAGRHGKSMAEIVRESIMYRFQMEVDAVPKCANGHNCYVAHLHLVQQSTATPIVNPTPEQAARLVGPPAVVGS